MLLLENSFYDELSQIENRLGLAEGFFRSVRGESDWAFIIKIHALLEAAFSDRICANLVRPELLDIMSAIPMSDSHCGKVAFANSLGMLGDGEQARAHRGFIRYLSELRNMLAHDPRNVDYNLMAELDNKPTRESRFALFRKSDSFSSNDNDVFENVFLVNPKMVVWWSAVSTLARIYDFYALTARQAQTVEFLKSLVPK